MSSVVVLDHQNTKLQPASVGADPKLREAIQSSLFPLFQQLKRSIKQERVALYSSSSQLIQDSLQALADNLHNSLFDAIKLSSGFNTTSADSENDPSSSPDSSSLQVAANQKKTKPDSNSISSVTFSVASGKDPVPITNTPLQYLVKDIETLITAAVKRTIVGAVKAVIQSTLREAVQNAIKAQATSKNLINVQDTLQRKMSQDLAQRLSSLAENAVPKLLQESWLDSFESSIQFLLHDLHSNLESALAASIYDPLTQANVAIQTDIIEVTGNANDLQHKFQRLSNFKENKASIEMQSNTNRTIPPENGNPNEELGSSQTKAPIAFPESKTIPVEDQALALMQADKYQDALQCAVNSNDSDIIYCVIAASIENKAGNIFEQDSPFPRKTLLQILKLFATKVDLSVNVDGALAFLGGLLKALESEDEDLDELKEWVGFDQLHSLLQRLKILIKSDLTADQHSKCRTLIQFVNAYIISIK